MSEIAIDIGYGFTKVKSKDKEFKFPTAVALSKMQLVENRDNLLSFNGKKYLVGNDALKDAIPTRDYSFIYKYAPLLIYEALKEADMLNDEEIIIKTGLSLYDLEKQPEFEISKFKNRREEFKARISDFVINEKHFKPEIRLFAQGQGAWYNYCNKYGFIEDGYDVLVDIGYRTNDIIIFEDAQPSKANSNADDKGVNVIVNELQTFLNKKYDIALTEQKTAKVLKNKSIAIYGENKDLTEVIGDIADSYIDTLFSSLKAKYGSILKESQRVVITGGGAYILYDYKDTFPKNVKFDDDKEFEFANVRGYFEA